MRETPSNRGLLLCYATHLLRIFPPLFPLFCVISSDREVPKITTKLFKLYSTPGFPYTRFIAKLGSRFSRYQQSKKYRKLWLKGQGRNSCVKKIRWTHWQHSLGIPMACVSMETVGTKRAPTFFAWGFYTDKINKKNWLMVCPHSQTLLFEVILCIRECPLKNSPFSSSLRPVLQP